VDPSLGFKEFTDALTLGFMVTAATASFSATLSSFL
jgi:hypothetical protein